MNKFLRSALKIALHLIDQFPDEVNRVRDRVSDTRDRGRKAICGEESHSLGHLVSFAVGVGLGIGAGILFAPTSGEETRNSMRERVQEIGDRVRNRFSSEATNATAGIKTP